MNILYIIYIYSIQYKKKNSRLTMQTIVKNKVIMKVEVMMITTMIMLITIMVIMMKKKKIMMMTVRWFENTAKD